MISILHGWQSVLGCNIQTLYHFRIFVPSAICTKHNGEAELIVSYSFVLLLILASQQEQQNERLFVFKYFLLYFHREQ